MLTEEVACPATSQVIDEELDALSPHELEGCWRSLCAMMLLRTANLLTSQMLSRKEFAIQRRAAREWIDGKMRGVITFQAACEALDLEEECVRRGLFLHAESGNWEAINKMGLRRHVFGKLHESPAKNPAAPRVVACPELPDRDYVSNAGQGAGVSHAGTPRLPSNPHFHPD